jgi:L-ascorbate 6-phosphate lactonase
VRAPDVNRMPDRAVMDAWLEAARRKHSEPALSGRALIEAIDRQLSWPDSLAIWYLNQEGFAVKAAGKVFYFDLYLSDYLEELTDGRLDEHKRRFLPPIKPGEITNADYIFCSHDHLDHVDPPTLRDVAQASPIARFVIPEAARPTLLSAGISEERLITFHGDDEKQFDGLTVRSLPGAHIDVQYDEATGHFFQGWAVTANGVTLYHAGDTKMFDGLIERLRPLQVDVAFLPINGDDWFRYGRNIMGNFNYREAAHLAVAIGADVLIPMHFGQHAVNTEHPGHLIDFLQENYRYQKCHVLVPGEKYVYVK